MRFKQKSICVSFKQKHAIGHMYMFIYGGALSGERAFVKNGNPKAQASNNKMPNKGIANQQQTQFCFTCQCFIVAGRVDAGTFSLRAYRL